MIVIARIFSVCVGSIALLASTGAAAPTTVEKYCYDCHDHASKSGNLDLEAIASEEIAARAETWEKVVRKMQARQMPPIGKRRPTEKDYNDCIAELTTALDRTAAKHPNPGRTESFRRLTRTEYHNAIRDLLAVEIDAVALLPKDEASHGFDNITVGTISPTLLDRYILAAQKVGQLAMGVSRNKPSGDTFRVPADITQEEHVEGLPLGTRGGTLIPFNFPVDAQYEIQVRLARDRNEEIEGLHGSHELQILIDDAVLGQFTLTPPKDRNFEPVDRNLKLRVTVSAGAHRVGATFVKNSAAVVETKRQPYNVHFNMHRHPRLTPAVYQVTINGPYLATGPGESESRKRILIVTPKSLEDEEKCAEKILSSLMRRAYRRPIHKEDLDKTMAFYQKARKDTSFDDGIEAALESILVSAEFLIRVEPEPEATPPRTAYKISDLELATRLSFFLWSSIPDEELLSLAERNKLNQPKVLEQQVRRMLKDSRASNLANNFADQWLYLRNLETISPDPRLFPDFDDNLRKAMREETRLFFESIVKEDRSVLNLLNAKYTFLNERLAKHYGVPNVYGSQFRRVALEPNCGRGGLLRHASVLTVTSYATRTSPVIRGNWILGNLLGSPPPPPPANVPALKEKTISASLSVRARLAEHRANAQCASCHNLMDPVGFALENFDAVGRWREMENGMPVDASAGFPDGSQFVGVDGLEKKLLERQDLFVGTVAEKLLTFALGRGMEAYDAPAVRKIIHQAKVEHYQFSAIVLGIVNSTPFRWRNSL